MRSGRIPPDRAGAPTADEAEAEAAEQPSAASQRS
jgi:hypothetical protein